MNNIELLSSLNHQIVTLAKNAMSILTSDILADYRALVSGKPVGDTYDKGVRTSVWDTRYNDFVNGADTYGYRTLKIDRNIWAVPVVYDAASRALYVLSSTKNLRAVISNWDKGRRTHYLHLLTAVSKDRDNQQLSLFEDDMTEDSERFEKAQAILGELIQEAEHVVVIHYDYVGDNAFNGTISLLDREAHIAASISVDDYLDDDEAKKLSSMTPVDVEANASQEVAKPSLVAWRGKKKPSDGGKGE